MVKMAPATSASPTDAVVRAMFSSRIVPPKPRSTAMATTAAGKVAATVSPAVMPTYAFAAPSATAISAPSTTALMVSSGMLSEAGTKGLNSLSGIGFPQIVGQNSADSSSRLTRLSNRRDRLPGVRGCGALVPAVWWL